MPCVRFAEGVDSLSVASGRSIFRQLKEIEDFRAGVNYENETGLYHDRGQQYVRQLSP